jgi:hypothetical protein
MINRMIRLIIGISTSGLILHFGSHILVWNSQDTYVAKIRHESLALGICVACLCILIGSVIQMRIHRMLELTRIEEEIRHSSAISWRSAQHQQYEQVNSQSQQPTFQQRTFVTVDVLPTLEVLEETIH